MDGAGAAVQNDAVVDDATAAPSAEDTVKADELLKSVRRDINCLADNSKMTRKRALGNLSKVSLDSKGTSKAVLKILWDDFQKPVLKLFCDPVEKIREMSLEFTVDYVEILPSIGGLLPYLIPVIISRMGQRDIEEDSEEVRRLHLQLCLALLKKPEKDIPIYLDEFIQVLSRTITDSFPDVKKLSCECIIALAQRTSDRFHMGCKPLYKPLITNLGHQHSKVRVMALRAIQAVCLHGEKDCLNEFMVPLAQKSMDHAPTVRRALYTAVGAWLVELKDRYSFWHKLLTLMLNGITDDVEEIRELCRDKFHAAGALWEQENEDEIKDLLDFTPHDTLPLGCRILVDREFSKILPGLSRDIFDWTEGIRRQSANLLLVLLQYCQGKVTMHLEKVFATLFKAVRDEEQDIGKIAVHCVETIAMHTKPSHWVDMILHRFAATGMGLSDQIGTLVVLGGLLRNSDKALLTEHLTPIARHLASENVSGVHNTEMTEEVFLVVHDLLADAACKVDDTLGYFIFTTIVHARATAPSLERQFSAAIDMLACKQKLSVENLYQCHASTLLEELSETHATWTRTSFQRAVFETLLDHAGVALGHNVDTIMTIFYSNFQPERDPELRLGFFTLLSKLLSTSGKNLNSTGAFAHAETVITRIVLPNCVWRNGRVQSALRTAACMCLWALLDGGLVTADAIKHVLPELIPQMTSCLDDDVEDTRLIVCRIFEHVFRVGQACFVDSTSGYDKLHSTYPELLKRLDDNSDMIRMASLRTWRAYAECVAAQPYETSLYRAHAEVRAARA
eukprot:m.404509 g.404509  ORF g.404509 m.404509 type:complete len:792 (+) comp21198_c0_seq1:75-2450(+)